MPAAPPPAANRYYATSAIAATAAARAAAEARPRGVRAIWEVLARFQVAQAVLAPRAVDLMLSQQDVDVTAMAELDPAAFITSTTTLDRMLADLEDSASRIEAEVQRSVDARFALLVSSLTQDAGRAAESVAITARPRVQHVRHLNLPSCSRCAVLAGRVYRYSTGFERHPGCDCVMIPVTVASPDLTYDPAELARNGQVTGLSKADQQALADGADFSRIVNVRSNAAGLRESGRVLSRAGRPTPEAIYRSTNSREDAVAALKQAGYLR